MNSVQQYLVEEELEHYRDGYISRREFIRRATIMGAAASTAVAMVQSVGTPRAAYARLRCVLTVRADNDNRMAIS